MVDVNRAGRRLRLNDIYALTEDVDGKETKLKFKQNEGTNTFVAKSAVNPGKAYLYSLDLQDVDLVEVDAVEAGVSTQKEVDAYNKAQQDEADKAAGIKNKPGGEAITGTTNVGTATGSKVESVKHN